MALSTIQKDKILLAALPLAAQQGWTNDIIDQAVQKAGLKAAASVQAFPEGLTDLLDHFSDWSIRALEKEIDSRRLIQMKIRDRVSLCVEAWLAIMGPYKGALQASLGLSWQPRYGWLSVRHTAKLSDTIWHHCGDTATDFNYYTKRLLLSGVIVSTTLFWFKDQSKSHQNTHAFLADRIGNVMNFGKKMNEFKTTSRGFVKAASFLKKRAG